MRFAAALVCDPDLLVLDEPTVAMDVQARRQFWAAMRTYSGSGRTVLFATHYLAEAEEYADRVVMLRAGRIVADGSVAQVRALASGRVVAATVPGADPVVLAALPGVSRGAGRRSARCACSAPTRTPRCAALLPAFPAAHDVEVTAHGLEDAFVALTASEEN